MASHRKFKLAGDACLLGKQAANTMGCHPPKPTIELVMLHRKRKHLQTLHCTPNFRRWLSASLAGRRAPEFPENAAAQAEKTSR